MVGINKWEIILLVIEILYYVHLALTILIIVSVVNYDRTYNYQVKLARVNENGTREVKFRKVWFSWPILLFGGFAPLFRGDWKEFLWNLIPFYWIYSSFRGNKRWILRLLEKGWSPADEESKRIVNKIKKKGIKPKEIERYGQ